MQTSIYYQCLIFLFLSSNIVIGPASLGCCKTLNIGIAILTCLKVQSTPQYRYTYMFTHSLVAQFEIHEEKLQVLEEFLACSIISILALEFSCTLLERPPIGITCYLIQVEMLLYRIL